MKNHPDYLPLHPDLLPAFLTYFGASQADRLPGYSTSAGKSYLDMRIPAIPPAQVWVFRRVVTERGENPLTEAEMRLPDFSALYNRQSPARKYHWKMTLLGTHQLSSTPEWIEAVKPLQEAAKVTWRQLQKAFVGHPGYILWNRYQDLAFILETAD